MVRLAALFAGERIPTFICLLDIFFRFRLELVG
jgi:hypothetical protein